jgi:molecular chaperone Hsp33
MTNDGAFRVIVARTTETVRGALRAQQAEGQTARHFGDLLTGAILFRETMAPPLRVQGIVKGAGGRGSLLADSHPSGKTRGLVQLPRGQRSVDLSQGAVMQVMRTMPGGRINQGVVEVPSSGGISQALRAYMQISEQVVSMLALGTVLEGNSVESAGGYLVQLLPEVGREPLAIMAERLSAFETIEARIRNESFTPEWLLDQLLHDMPYTRLDESGVGFDCWCDELRLVSAISTLSRADIEHLLLGGDVLEITCDYCGKEYRISPATLRGLLQES